MRLLAHHTASPLGRADPRLKIALVLTMSLWVVLVDSLAMLLAAVAVGLLVFIAARPSATQVKMALAASLLVVWATTLTQGFFFERYPRQTLLVLLPPNAVMPDGLRIYREGLQYGLVQSLRMLAMGLTGYAICFSTEPDRFMRALAALRVPFSLALMAVSAVRFLPIAIEQWATVRQAMRLKGYRPLRRGLVDTVRTELAALRPVLASTVRRSREIALSILTRGFSLDAPRTEWRTARLGPAHWLALTTMVALVTGVTVCKMLFWLYQQEVYYHAALRPLYQFVRHWL